MYIVDFMNAHKENWQKLLSMPPYCLTITQDGPYYLLFYRQGETDFSNPLALEARGSIFAYDESSKKWWCCCRALDKFFNWSEPNAAPINWSRGVRIQEKVDGSIIKLWFDRGDWHISTNKTIDARKAECGMYTYFQLFCRALGNVNIHNFFIQLHPSYTYFFELVSPMNRIVIKYADTALYYLGARNMFTMEEEKPPIELETLRHPRSFFYNSLAECIEAAHAMGDDEEGYVVVSNERVNGSNLRVKVKGDEYLRLHYLSNNHILTYRTVVDMWRNDELDDYCAYFPERAPELLPIIEVIKWLITYTELAYEPLMAIEEDKLFAQEVQKQDPILSGALFALRRHKARNVYDYYHNVMHASSLAHLVERLCTLSQE